MSTHQQASKDVKKEVLDVIEELENFLKNQAKRITVYLFEQVEKIVRQKSNLDVYEVVGMIPERKVLEALDIKPTLLRKWRLELGLKRYKPNKDSNKAYYDIEELKEFVKRVED